MTRKLVLSVGILSVLLSLGGGVQASDPGWQHANEWDTYTVPTATIISPNESQLTNGVYWMPINDSVELVATATDPDKYRCTVGAGGDGVWYDYYDDVTSGTTSSTYHMSWSVSGGGELSTEYGTSTTYTAPDYAVGSDVRDVSFTATPTDIDRPGDEEQLTANNDATPVPATLPAKVWQITVTKDGAHDGDNAKTAPAWGGGTTLGWTIPGTPADCTDYGWNVEFKGTIPAGVNTAGMTFAWVQKRKGTIKYTDGAGQHDDVPAIADGNPDVWANEADDSPLAAYQQTTPVNDKVFMVDCPGWIAGATNNTNVAAGWTEYDRKRDYRCYVTSGGKVISNKFAHYPYFKINVVTPATTWSVTSHSFAP
jgi:hypothetical protein